MRALAPLVLAFALAGGSALAAPPAPTQRIELTKMMGRWYEVARLPNKIQTVFRLAKMTPFSGISASKNDPLSLRL